jgi:hypothetical protein
MRWGKLFLLATLGQSTLVLRGGQQLADWNVHLALKTHRLHKKAKQTFGLLGSGAGHKVAVAITVTKDPDFSKQSKDRNSDPGGFVDGAAILAHSVALTQSPEYPVSMIALVNPKVQKMRPLLTKMGYRVVEYIFPFTSAEIKGPLKDVIDESGCCGMAELAKLGAYTLTEFEKVLIMDSDTLLLQNIDELWSSKKDILYTYDHGLKGGCINGGFAMIRPDQKQYQGVLDTIKAGEFYTEGNGTAMSEGWGRTHMGYCYGGQTFQGVMPYFYQNLHGGDWQEVDSCVYDSMAASTNSDGRKQHAVPFKEVKTFHFTLCQKPWSCYLPNKDRDEHVLCMAMHDRWWEVRTSYEKKMGLAPTGRCKGKEGSYDKLKFV